MTEEFLRHEVIEYLSEQNMVIAMPFVISTSLLCLLAAINDYSFSDQMISDLPQFLPTQEEINKYK